MTNSTTTSKLMTSGYYRIIKADDHTEHLQVQTGDVVFGYFDDHHGKRQFHIRNHNHIKVYNQRSAADRDEFREHFEPAPDGLAIRQQQIADVMADINNSSTDVVKLQNDLNDALAVSAQEAAAAIAFTPTMRTSAGVPAETMTVAADPDGDFDNALTAPEATASLSGAKKAVAEVRNQVAKTRKALLSKQEHLKALIGEQQRIMEIKVKEMTEMITQAERAIWTVNLYLGRDEQIIMLRDGEPAAATAKIALRQQVNFMDEECALFASSGGIDVEMLDQFDGWLLEDQAHVNQLLPEEKGIVGLRVRRRNKNYDNRYWGNTINKANLTYTYLLIRNGERLYRIFIDIVMGEHFFPAASDFDTTFKGLTPGSPEYLAALDAASTENHHFLRIALVVQGLLDRTTVLKPLPPGVDRLNCCNPADNALYFKLIYDAENAITDGRPTFFEWRDAINSKLEVGHRIIGSFGYEVGRGEYRQSRLYPETAEYPPSNVLHLLDGVTDSFNHHRDSTQTRYTFHYERRDVWRRRDRWGSRSKNPSPRASCWVTTDDDFILNFDACTLEEVNYYLGRRRDRAHGYEEMIPVLEAAKALKEAEAQAEAPFRLLLIGQIMKEHQVDRTHAEADVDELINWWKFKCRNHRALSSDDKKAVTMIVQEFGARRRQRTIRDLETEMHDLVRTAILAHSPDAVAIFHARDNRYVAYVPHHADRHVWAREQDWRYNRQTRKIALRESVDWKLVDTRHRRWGVIYKADRFEQWTINPQRGTVLTDAEVDQVIADGLSIIKRGGWCLNRYLPLCVQVADNYRIEVWNASTPPTIPTELLISSKSDDPEIYHAAVTWERKQGKLTVRIGDVKCGGRGFDADDVPWRRAPKEGGVVWRLHTEWPENLVVVKTEWAAWKDYETEKCRLNQRYDYAERLIQKFAYERKVAVARYDFLKDHGDPELWDDHLKTLTISEHYPTDLCKVMSGLSERYVDIVGKTASQLWQEAVTAGIVTGDLPSDWPGDFVIPPPKTDDDD